MKVLIRKCTRNQNNTPQQQTNNNDNNNITGHGEVSPLIIIIIIMHIYHALINGLSAHMIHINLNMIFYTHVEHSPTQTIYIKYY